MDRQKIEQQLRTALMNCLAELNASYQGIDLLPDDHPAVKVYAEGVLALKAALPTAALDSK